MSCGLNAKRLFALLVLDGRPLQLASCIWFIAAMHNPPTDGEEARLRELLRTNDPVLISFVEALLSSEGIPALVLDQNMSVLDGSIGVLPRRVMVGDEEFVRATEMLRQAGLDAELRRGGKSP